MESSEACDRKSVVLCDDHSIVRHAIRTILESSDRFRIVGEADSAEETLELMQERQPDLLVLDLGLPGKSGIEAIYELKRLGLSSRIVVLTMYDDEAKAQQAANAGADGYVLKSCSPSDFMEALSNAMSGRTFFPAHYALSGQDGNARNTGGNGSDPLGKLSKREREVFYLLAEGLPNRVIAKKLFISPRTVETHRARVIKKLGFTSTADLIRYAIRNNLVAA